jgi:tetratricopeptide (TPR) repeat protein
MAREKKGDLSGALADYNKAVELAPLMPFYMNRGNLWLDQGDFDAAIADGTKASEVEPRKWEGWLRGLAHLRAGHDADAKQDFDDCVRLEPNMREAVEKAIKSRGRNQPRVPRQSA